MVRQFNRNCKPARRRPAPCQARGRGWARLHLRRIAENVMVGKSYRVWILRRQNRRRQPRQRNGSIMHFIGRSNHRICERRTSVDW